VSSVNYNYCSYCHPTRPFYPLPNFKDAEALPRTRTLDEGEWFTATYSGGTLGEKFACYRGAGWECGGSRFPAGEWGSCGVITNVFYY